MDKGLARPRNWCKLPKQSLGIEILCGPKGATQMRNWKRLYFILKLRFESHCG